MLTKSAIIDAVNSRDIRITSFDEANVGPHSYDVTLNSTLLTYVKLAPSQYKPEFSRVLDCREHNQTFTTTIPESGLILWPGVLYLGSTNEFINTDMYGCQFDGRSSIGRLGISTHQCAGYVDVGFSGNITLELSVIQPVRIYADIRIGQVSFFPLTGEITKYSGKYQNAIGAEASKLYEDK